MNLEQAQAVLRKHGLEDFPRPWIFETASILLDLPTDPRPDEVAFFISMDIDGMADKYRLSSKIARETALMMGWRP